MDQEMHKHCSMGASWETFSTHRPKNLQKLFPGHFLGTFSILGGPRDRLSPFAEKTTLQPGRSILLRMGTGKGGGGDRGQEQGWERERRTKTGHRKDRTKNQDGGSGRKLLEPRHRTGATGGRARDEREREQETVQRQLMLKTAEPKTKRDQLETKPM